MTYREIKREIGKDEWIEIRCSGDHHQYRKAGNPFVVTIPDHGSRDLSIGVIKSIEKKTGLTLR